METGTLGRACKRGRAVHRPPRRLRLRQTWDAQKRRSERTWDAVSNTVMRFPWTSLIATTAKIEEIPTLRDLGHDLRSQWPREAPPRWNRRSRSRCCHQTGRRQAHPAAARQRYDPHTSASMPSCRPAAAGPAWGARLDVTHPEAHPACARRSHTSSSRRAGAAGARRCPPSGHFLPRLPRGFGHFRGSGDPPLAPSSPKTPVPSPPSLAGPRQWDEFSRRWRGSRGGAVLR
mmetsp:Transcript_13674/g.50963  ORF Transcript_13674/g.50963 Transcript_13674/m.50963 type:complete len:232 (+) Transcript_13674:938-1633(+)